MVLFPDARRGGDDDTWGKVETLESVFRKKCEGWIRIFPSPLNPCVHREEQRVDRLQQTIPVCRKKMAVEKTS
jgi:hypothetical protein